MFNAIERPPGHPPSAARLAGDFGPLYAAHGFIGWLFAITGPVAIVLSVGANGGLSRAEIASWIFGVFFINGLITLLLSWRYREPLVLFWTIPGTVLVGQSLTHLSFAQVVGAFYGTALLMFILGLSGWVKRAMQLVPMPIVMGMVAGVFLRFGLDLVRSVLGEFAIAGPMVMVWLILTALPSLGRRCPPIIGALVIGTVAAILLGKYDHSASLQLALIHPVVPTPSWSLPAMIELIVPLAVTVLVVQNGQGFAVLSAAGHKPPVNLVTVACGIGSALAAIVGGVSTCLTGPTNAIVVSGGEPDRHYTAAMMVGVLALGFGLLAPTFTTLLLIAPKALITALAGLAMLRVLQTAFVTAFKTNFSLGALVAFLVTVADGPLLNIGAAFWGLVAGFAISWMLERADFTAAGA
ncbi:Putative permease of the major facilitator superfamily (MFS); putative benzoate transporter [Bradyrhizobium sp. ORS 278]|uniref:benzoate/H(+) symporter BenE family transporter n=1 Tax=Bradyrhizobium sp. (strain ORS 278) TaxID=114615 RepID=UPI00015081BC|nr:benzoate/H(+) symporter BenE family transporter [Bradyrhizobium sp. ORS 278]CAL79674.1 Putative permease of the major facilitator superfamily (MFS); putative benzoate transporter [Bradyrhizobium sp. ORS 278]